MNYALLDENNIVINIIWMYPDGIDAFPNAVPLNDVSATMGDVYKDGKFYRDGEIVLSPLESAYLTIKTKDETIAELDAALLDATYESIIGGI